MKMLRRIAYLLIIATIVAVLAAALFGCSFAASENGGDDTGTGEQEHEHTFSTEWTTDIDWHYHAATCGHNEKADLAEHELETETSDVDDIGEYYTCKVCGYLKPIGHDYGEPEVLDDEKLCTEQRRYRKTCRRCGYECEYLYSYSYHDYSAWEIVSDELHTRTCNRCNYVGSHPPKLVGAQVVQAADCTHPGVQKGTCYDCWQEITVPLPSSGHTWDYSSADDISHSCMCKLCGETDIQSHVFLYASERDGLFHSSYCEDCNFNLTIMHDFSDGECLCGLTYAQSDGLIYAPTDGGLTVVGIGSFNGSYLYIPVEHDGEAVVGIAEGAFADADQLKSVYVPDSVTNIGAGAFSGCDSITSMRLPFVGAQKRTATELHQYPIGYIFGEYGGGRAQTFYDDSLEQTTQKYYAVPSSLKYISVSGGMLLSGALKNTDITDIILESGVTAIERNALDDNRELRLTVSDTVTSIADGVLTDSSFSSLHVDGNNPRYKYSGRCFIDMNEKTVLTALPDCVIPSDGTVTKLGYCAFSNRAFSRLPNGRSLVIPSTIEYIGVGCFYNANIGVKNEAKGLTYIGAAAFSGCGEAQGFTLETDGDIYIGDAAFTDAAGVVKITCASLSAGDRAFNGSGITLFTLDCESATFGRNVFSDCRELSSIKINGDSVQIGENLASGSYRLLAAEISGLTALGGGAFKDCVVLYRVSLSGEIEKITGSTFSGCSALRNLTLPESIDEIESNAFSDCSSLVKVEIPDSVTKLGYYIFNKCSSLAELKVPFLPYGTLGYLFSKTQYTGSYAAVQGGSSATSTFYIPTALKKVSVSRGDLTYAFSDCTSLTEINLGVNGQFSGELSVDSFKNAGISYLDVPNGLTLNTGAVFAGMKNLKTVVWRLNTDVAGPYFSNCPNVEKLTVASGVTAIVPEAFYGLNGLKEVYVADTVTEIGQYAFGGSALTTLSIPFLDGTLGKLFSAVAVPGSAAVTQSTADGDTVYYIPTTLTDVTVGGDISDGAFMGSFITSVTFTGGTTALGDNAFKGCSGITSIVCPTVTEIGISVFEGCTNVARIELGDLTELKAYAFKNCRKLSALVAGMPDNMTVIPAGLFDGCAQITAFDVQSTVGAIGERAFAGTAITDITLPQLLTEICNGTFDGCVKLTEIAIPANVTSIGNNAFRGCAALTAAAAAGSLNSIGANAFYGCSALTAATLPGTYTTLPTAVFDGCVMLNELTIAPNITAVEKRALAMCAKIDTFDFSKLTEIGDEAFAGCAALGEVTIPSGLITIGKGAFSGCTGVTTVRLYAPSALSSATESSPIFSGCTALTTVEIGGAVRSIPAYIFAGCKNITSVALGGGAITEICEGAFMNTGLTALAIDGLADGIVIGRRAFYGCADIAEFRMKSGQFTIGEQAFFGMNKQTALVLELGQNASVGEGAFGGWSALAEVATNDVTGGEIYKYYFGRIFGGEEFDGGIACTQHNGVSSGSSVYYLPAALKKVTVTGGKIGRGTFSGLSEISQVVILDPVDDLFSPYVFSGCSSLTTLTIPEKYAPTSIPEHMFAGCALTALELLQNVSLINESAFEGSKISNVTMGGSAVNIYANAFKNCEQLTSFTLRSIYPGTIYNYAFAGCSALTTFVSNSTAKLVISKSAFEGCESLLTIDFSKSSSVELSEYVFKDCRSLTEINFDNVTGIGKGALSGCTGIAELNLKFVGKSADATATEERTVAYIYGDLPYEGGHETTIADAGKYFIPTALKKINLTEGTIYTNSFKGCVGATEINIPDQNIPGAAFVDCASLTTLDFKSKLIGDRAFENCTSLSNVSLGTEITEIGEQAFSGCTALQQISMPQSLMLIGKAAFKGCTNLNNAQFAVKDNWLYGDTGHSFIPSEKLAAGDTAAQALLTYQTLIWKRLF